MDRNATQERVSQISAATDKIRSCCDQCASSKTKCDSKRPVCLNCSRRDRRCTYSYIRQSGRPRRVRPAQRSATSQDEAVERREESVNHMEAGQIEAASNIAAIPSSGLVCESDSSLLQILLTGEAPNHREYHDLSSDPDLVPTSGNTITDFLGSLTGSDMQSALSADYFALEPADTTICGDVSSVLQDRTHENILTSHEQSSMMDIQTVPLLSTASHVHQLELGLRDLLDDSTVSRIVDGMMNSPQQEPLSCETSSCATVYEIGGRKQDCRCPALLNKLYLIVMDPKLSRPTTALPLDLILFVEQALQNAVKKVTLCTACGSPTLSSENGITVCIVADWITSNIQVALETEIDASRHPTNPFWGCPGRQSNEINTTREQFRGDTREPATVPPSLDVRNTLWIGMWCASGEAWILCMSEILARRIKRIQQMFSAVGGDNSKVLGMLNNRATLRAKHEMAKDIHTKTEILLGMVKNWVTECQLRY